MTETDAIAPLPRRVVTGEDSSGRSRVWIDGEPKNVKTPTDWVRSVLLWATEGAPAEYAGDDDAGDWQLATNPPPGGSRLVHLTLAPGEEHTQHHRTDTLDYSVCVVGEMTMYLDDDSVVLRPGDVCVQRGTAHSWANHGDGPAVTLNVLLDGRPKRSGSLTGRDQAR